MFSPPTILQPSATAQRRLQLPLPLDASVSAKLEALLARCDRVKRGTEITKPTVFNAAGEQHAREVAKAGRKNDMFIPKRELFNFAA